MVHWSPFVMSFKKKYPWIQLAGHAGTKRGEGQSGGKALYYSRLMSLFSRIVSDCGMNLTDFSSYVSSPGA